MKQQRCMPKECKKRMTTKYEKVFCDKGHKANPMYARNFITKSHLRILNYWYCEVCNIVFRADDVKHKGVVAN